MVKTTLLTENQAWTGSGKSLAVLMQEGYGIKVAPTDLAIILGAPVVTNGHTSEGDFPCSVWSKGEVGRGHVGCVDPHGYYVWGNTYDSHNGVRPALPPEETSKIRPENVQQGPNGVQIAEYGEYPQTIVSEDVAKQLEAMSLHPTGKQYHFSAYGSPCPEYWHNGEKYVCVQPKSADDDDRFQYKYHFCHGHKLEMGQTYWLRVEPIQWLMDPSGTWISKKCLLAGISFDDKSYRGDFSNTLIAKFLKDYFDIEMLPTEGYPKAKSLANTSSSSEENAAKKETKKEEPKVAKTPVVKSKKTEKATKRGILKTLDLATKARILDEDKDVAALRHDREDILATATAGITDPKKKNAILRRIDVQDLRDKEGEARAAKLGKLLKGKQADK